VLGDLVEAVVVGTMLLVRSDVVEDVVDARCGLLARDVAERLLHGPVLGRVLGDLMQAVVVGTMGAILACTSRDVVKLLVEGRLELVQ